MTTIQGSSDEGLNKVVMGEWKEKLLEKKRSTLDLGVDERCKGGKSKTFVISREMNFITNKSLQKEEN